MTATDTGMEKLKSRHPEWAPWLAVVQEIIRQTADPKWDALVPDRAALQQSKVPLIAEATLDLSKSSVPALLEQLMRTACRSGTPKMATLEALAEAKLDVGALFRASLQQDRDYINRIAAAHGADPEALQAVAAIAPLPFLHACNRRWAGRLIAIGWTEGYCPVCGAWPAFAEVRGIERSRHFRCGRCGGEWQAQCLICPFCGMTDHNELVSLVPENSGSNGVIDACKRCLGYVKTFTTLQGSPPVKVLLDDLESVELDVAAVEQGYKRPEGNGYSLNVTIASNGGVRGQSA
jgi:FdhE protein